MNLSPPSSLGSTSTPSSSSSASTSTLHPNSALSCTLRRRSVDTGGLNLVVNDRTGSGSGRGYGGWVEHKEESSSGPLDVANLVIALREETNNIIDQAHPRANTSHTSSSDTNPLREKYVRDLSQWQFDASHLPLDEVLLCTNILFELLWTIEGMEMAIGLTFDKMPSFLARVSKIYRERSSYHNFQHALDVLQATYFYLQEEGCVPSILHLLNIEKLWTRPQVSLLQRALRNEDLFALFIAAIGHDIGHPGVSNAFLKNAKTPLAELFSDDSVLEKMHCTLLLQTMRKHGMSHLLDSSPETSEYFHSTPKPPLLVKTILATDMSVHGQWMTMLSEFNERQRKLENRNRPGHVEMPVDSQTRLLLCQALLKCADISNPSRPPPVCEHWSTSLITEWMEQAFLERKFELPISVSASKDPKATAQGQIGFIKACTLPLLEAAALYMPTMVTFRDQCNDNLIMWQAKIDEIDANMATDDSVSQSTSENGLTRSQLSLPISPPDMTTMFALSLPAVVYTPSIEYRHTLWSGVEPGIDRSSSSLHELTGESSDIASVNVRINGAAHSEPSSPSVGSDLQLFHRRHPTHIELPQVSIPSERSSPSPSLSTLTSTTSHNNREVLRAVYEAHGRSKTRKWENRISWSPASLYNMNSAPTARSVSLLDPPVPQETPSGS
ncbi:hypothetical protein BU17DRAFT_58437 [Hysterangium stoloniferum]|nr:hypothetical protein BU17DRAFT_58437 [Hysterangium stoloniferum]